MQEGVHGKQGRKDHSDSSGVGEAGSGEKMDLEKHAILGEIMMHKSTILDQIPTITASLGHHKHNHENLGHRVRRVWQWRLGRWVCWRDLLDRRDCVGSAQASHGHGQMHADLASEDGSSSAHFR
ncbi:hypothetical protein FCV25MIE_25632 [Fagus crenata]